MPATLATAIALSNGAGGPSVNSTGTVNVHNLGDVVFVWSARKANAITLTVNATVVTYLSSQNGTDPSYAVGYLIPGATGALEVRSSGTGTLAHAAAAAVWSGASATPVGSTAFSSGNSSTPFSTVASTANEVVVSGFWSTGSLNSSADWSSGTGTVMDVKARSTGGNTSAIGMTIGHHASSGTNSTVDMLTVSADTWQAFSFTINSSGGVTRPHNVTSWF